MQARLDRSILVYLLGIIISRFRNAIIESFFVA
jgi:hypothetical protein